jgi:hypothetical protein
LYSDYPLVLSSGNRASSDILQKHSCDVVQGYHYAHSMDLGCVTALIQRGLSVPTETAAQ